jgi:hypothetical protein
LLGKTVAALSAALLFGLLLASPVSAERRFSPSVQAARHYALDRVGAVQFRCLDALFERESHWNPRAHNKRSGAHGIPQSLPASKMRKFGADYMTNPLVQVKWGLYYIHGRYGTPCAALQHAYSTGWY